MRTFLILAFVCTVTFRIASAEAPYGPVGGGSPDEMAGQLYGAAGCGLGTKVWGSAPGMAQAMAVTTNLILFNQSFGLTFGTLGCIDDDQASEAIEYSEANKEILVADIARGEGETVTVLGELLHCSPASALGAKLQPRFGRLIPRPEAFSGKSLIHSIRQDAELNALCPGNRT